MFLFLLDGASDALYQTVEAIQGKPNHFVLYFLLLDDFRF